MNRPLEKNGIWFYPGLRRMMPVPWKYKIPEFEILTGRKKPPEFDTVLKSVKVSGKKRNQQNAGTQELFK